MSSLSSFFERAFAEIDSAYERRLIMARAEYDGRVKTLIDSFRSDPWGLLAWLSRYAPRRFLSTSEAVAWLEREIERQKIKADLRHWSYSPEKLASCAERLEVARFYQEHGRRVWAREAA